MTEAYETLLACAKVKFMYSSSNCLHRKLEDDEMQGIKKFRILSYHIELCVFV